MSWVASWLASSAGPVAAFPLCGAGRFSRAAALSALAFRSGLARSVVCSPVAGGGRCLVVFVGSSCALGACPAVAAVPLVWVRSAGPGGVSCG